MYKRNSSDRVRNGIVFINDVVPRIGIEFVNRHSGAVAWSMMSFKKFVITYRISNLTTVIK